MAVVSRQQGWCCRRQIEMSHLQWLCCICCLRSMVSFCVLFHELDVLYGVIHDYLEWENVLVCQKNLIYGLTGVHLCTALFVQ